MGPPASANPAPQPSYRKVAPLRSADRLALPVGQSAAAPPPRREDIVEEIQKAVAAGGFALVESSLPRPPGPGDGTGGSPFGTLIAERKIRRVTTSQSMRVSMAVLLGAGAGLGGLDLIVGGSWIYAAPWVVVAGVGAFLLWLRYGRSYESEVVAVSVLPLATARVSGTGGVTAPEATMVRWSAGRIRSVAFAGARAAVDVKDCPVPLMEALAQMVRRFQSTAS